MNRPIGDQVADHLEQQKDLQDMIERQQRQLYAMTLFDVIPYPDGAPMVTRVPGGWVWCIRSGGVTIKTSSEQQVIGNEIMAPVFVAYSDEFNPDKPKFVS